MSWNDILGHERQVHVLRTAVERQRSAHAYLFLGEPGVGKRTVAGVLAGALLCESDTPSGRPCGVCRSCQHELDDHPDFYGVEPTGASIKIEQVRAVQRELAFAPSWQRHKVFCFDQADTLTEQAQNALLKSLEEPPSYASFILIAQHSKAILPTVRSRCIQVRFGRVDTSVIAQTLEQQGMQPEQAHLMAALSFGRPGAAQAANAEEVLATRAVVIDWVEHLFRQPGAVWYVGEALEQQRERAPLLIDLLTLWLRDLLLVCTGRSESIVNRDMQAVMANDASTLSPVGLADGIAALLELKENWDRHANFRLALDVALINLQRGLRSA